MYYDRGVVERGEGMGMTELKRKSVKNHIAWTAPAAGQTKAPTRV